MNYLFPILILLSFYAQIVMTALIIVNYLIVLIYLITIITLIVTGDLEELGSCLKKYQAQKLIMAPGE